MTDQRKMFYDATPQIFQRAKELRNNMTRHELLLWEELRANKMLGLRFKAQHPIGLFIADFYCHKIKLVIEIDGENHSTDEAKEYDSGRETEMLELGIQSIRFINEEVEHNMISVLDEIKKTCKQIVENQSFTPSLKGGTDFGVSESPLQGVGGKTDSESE